MVAGLIKSVVIFDKKYWSKQGESTFKETGFIYNNLTIFDIARITSKLSPSIIIKSMLAKHNQIHSFINVVWWDHHYSFFTLHYYQAGNSRLTFDAPGVSNNKNWNKFINSLYSSESSYFFCMLWISSILYCTIFQQFKFLL